MRNFTSLVQEVLKTNVNMASRLRNLERMHPAMAASFRTSQNDTATSEGAESRAISRMTYYKFAFEEELETSPAYKKAGLNQIRFSKSSTSSNGPSYLSGLSLCDVSNVSAIALPISSMELWNHHRYRPDATGSANTATSLDAWYNPSAKVRNGSRYRQIEALTTSTEERLYKDRLLQRSIHESVRPIEVHRTSDIPALYSHYAALSASLHRRRNHASKSEGA